MAIFRNLLGDKKILPSRAQKLAISSKIEKIGQNNTFLLIAPSWSDEMAKFGENTVYLCHIQWYEYKNV